MYLYLSWHNHLCMWPKLFWFGTNSTNCSYKITLYDFFMRAVVWKDTHLAWVEKAYQSGSSHRTLKHPHPTCNRLLEGPNGQSVNLVLEPRARTGLRWNTWASHSNQDGNQSISSPVRLHVTLPRPSIPEESSIESEVLIDLLVPEWATPEFKGSEADGRSDAVPPYIWSLWASSAAAALPVFDNSRGCVCLGWNKDSRRGNWGRTDHDTGRPIDT